MGIHLLPGIIADACADALALLLPIECAGCDAADTALCVRCRAQLRPEPVHGSLPDGTPLVWALAFDGVVARVVRALKSEGRTGLARDLAPAVRAVADAVGTRVVVPIPSSREAMRRRGYRPVEVLAARAGLGVARALSWRRAIEDQRRLGRLERSRNAAGSLRASGVAGASVVVFDDIVTTGATLTEAARALREAGAAHVTAIAVAATPRRLGGSAVHI